MYLPLEADLTDIVVSRDGTLAAYVSNESGTNEVYIRSFPEPGERTPVSQGGGYRPFWSADGNTVFYWSGALIGGGQDFFVATHIQRDPTTVVLSTDTLFAGDYFRPVIALHPDGDRVIVGQVGGASTTSDGAGGERERLILVTNWFEELRQRMGN